MGRGNGEARFAARRSNSDNVAIASEGVLALKDRQSRLLARVAGWVDDALVGPASLRGYTSAEELEQVVARAKARNEAMNERYALFARNPFRVHP